MALQDFIFNPIEVPTVGKRDISVLKNTIDTINNFDIQRIQTRNEIADSIAKYRDILVDDDNGENYQFLFNLQRQIEDSINSPVENGDYRGGMMNAFKAVGDLIANPELQARIKSSKDYTIWKDELMKRNDITEETKEWALGLNSYNHQNIYDKKGNVVGGKTWTPNFTPTSDVDFTQIFEDATKQMSQEVGGGSSIYYKGVDAQGNSFYTTDRSQSVDGLMYYEKENGYYNYNRKDFADAVNAVLYGNPAYLQGMKQQYNMYTDKIQKDENGNNIPNQVTTNSGYPLSFEQYINKLTDPLLNAKIVYNPAGRITEFQAAKSLVTNNTSTAKKSNSDNDTNGNLFNILSGLKGPSIGELALQEKVTNLGNIKSSMNEILNEYKSMAYRYNIPSNCYYDDYGKELSEEDQYIKLVNYIYSIPNIDNAEKQQILNELSNKHINYQDKLDTYNKGIDNENIESLNFTSAVDARADFTQFDNKYSTKISKDIDDLFKLPQSAGNTYREINKTDSIKVKFSRDEMLSIGQYYNYYDNGGSLKDYFDVDYGSGTVTLKNDQPNDILYFAQILNKMGIEAKTDTGYKLSSILKGYNQAIKDTEKTIAKKEKADIYTPVKNVEIYPDEQFYNRYAKDLDLKYSDYNGFTKIAHDELIEILKKPFIYGNGHLYVSNDESENLLNATVGELNSDYANDIANIISSDKTQDAYSLNFARVGGKLGILVTINNANALSGTYNGKYVDLEKIGSGKGNKPTYAFVDIIPDGITEALSNSSLYVAERGIYDYLDNGIYDFNININDKLDKVSYNPLNKSWTINNNPVAFQDVINEKQIKNDFDSMISTLSNISYSDENTTQEIFSALLSNYLPLLTIIYPNTFGDNEKYSDYLVERFINFFKK